MSGQTPDKIAAAASPGHDAPSEQTASSPPVVDAERAIQLGHPSYVWRTGQERRLEMVRRHVALEEKRILDLGCGLGMYTEAFSRYSQEVYGTEIELERAREALQRATGVVQSIGEALPFRSNTFDVVFSHEVIEHVTDDEQVVREAVRVTRPGGRIVLFCPNRLWPFETHGVYLGNTYHFGNIPLVNYLPDVLRNRLAWHVRTYTRRSLLALFDGLPVQVCAHSTVYPGFDNVIARAPTTGKLIYGARALLERWPFARQFGLSHLLVVEKV